MVICLVKVLNFGLLPMAMLLQATTTLAIGAIGVPPAAGGLLRLIGVSAPPRVA